MFHSFEDDAREALLYKQHKEMRDALVRISNFPEYIINGGVYIAAAAKDIAVVATPSEE